jgi:hypothetical protein
VQIVAERALLTGPRRIGGEKTRRAETAQIGRDDATAGGDQWRDDLVIAAWIVRPAMHEKDRDAIRGAALFIGNVEYRGLSVFKGSDHAALTTDNRR